MVSVQTFWNNSADLAVFDALSKQGPFQLAAAGPQSFRTRVPQKVRSHRPLLLRQVSPLSISCSPMVKMCDETCVVAVRECTRMIPCVSYDRPL